MLSCGIYVFLLEQFKGFYGGFVVLGFFFGGVVYLVFCLPSPYVLNNADVLAVLETEEIT